MKKLFISAAILVAMCASCTSESFIDVPENNVEISSNKIMFDEESEAENDLMRVCQDIISVHCGIEMFDELLSPEMFEKIANKNYSLDDAVSVIYLWWENEDTYDCMCEYPTWDEFIPIVTKTRFIKEYPFYY